MPRIYAVEPVMHDGQVYLPGEPMDVDVNDGMAIIGSGRGTQDADAAKVAKKQYAAAQASAAAQPADTGSTQP